MKYAVILERDEDGYFAASVPALSGCFTQGKTLEEVMVNIKEAIELYIEDLKEHGGGRYLKTPPRVLWT